MKRRLPHKIHVLSLSSRVQAFVTLWTVTRQVLLSMGFSRQEHGSGLPCPPPGDLSEPEMEPISPAPPALTGGFFTTSATWEAPNLQDAAEAVLRRKFKVIQVKVQVTESFVSDALDYTVHGILQARTVEWVATPFSRGSIQPRDGTQVSCIAGGFFTS